MKKQQRNLYKVFIITIILMLGIFGVKHFVNDAVPNQPRINIILNTIPKSASVYINKTLEVGLGCTQFPISEGYFPHDNISFKEMNKFKAQQCVISKSHFDASVLNQQILQYYRAKVVLQFRDPREVLLSWVYYLQKIKKEHKTIYLYYIAPTPPDEYYLWDLTQQIDWNIEHFLPLVVEWMQTWLKFIELQAHENKVKILITTYDEFVENQSKFYKKILDFYAIPASRFNYQALPKNINLHFRNGNKNEWRNAFTKQQKHRIAQLIPTELLEKFNWPKS